MFTPDFAAAIATYAALVVGVCETIKRALKVSGGVAVALSFLVALVVCLPELSGDAVRYAVLVVFAFLSANGWYKVVKAAR